MKIFKSNFYFYMYQHFIFLFLFLNCKNELTYQEFQTNFGYIRSFSESPILKEESSVKPLTLLNEEINLFHKFIISTLEDTDTFGNPNCLYFLSETFKNYTLSTLKFIQDSSHSLSKLGSYQDCKYKIYYNYTDNTTSNYLNYSYILFYTPSSLVNPRPTLFSVCIPHIDYCQNEDYGIILESFNLKTEFFDSTQIGGVEVYVINDDTKKPNDKFYIGSIVLGIFALILLCEIFPSIPVCLFKCCFKKKTISQNNLKNSKKDKILKKIDIYETSSLSNLEKSFDLRDSIGEIMGVESNAGINNDSGISFLKGLRGICLMLYILGENLEAVYQYPVKKSERIYFNTKTLSFLYFFNRLTKNLFLSISSFSLCFKILCYFDNEIEQNELKNENIKIDDINSELINNTIKEYEEEDEIIEINNKKSRKNSKNKKSLSSSSSKSNRSPENLSGSNTKKNNSGSFSSIEKSKSGKKSFNSGDLTNIPTISQYNVIMKDKKLLYNKISFKSFFRFLFRQFYKYILFVGVILYLRYFYYDFVSSMGENPMWEFIKNSYVNKLEKNHMLAIVFLYFPFYSKVNSDVAYAPYDIIILEISLFIVCSLILFITYKINFRFDLILFIMFLVGIGLKIILYFIIEGRTGSVYEEYFFPSKGFTNNKWKFIFNNPLYYIPCTSIGLFFGLVNYAIQKSAKNIKDFRDKLYLSIPIKFINRLRKKAYLFSVIFSIIFFILFFWCGFSYYAMFLSEDKLTEDSLANNFFNNKFINIYYSIDIDIMVFTIFLAIIPFNLIGENSFMSFLKHEYWNILSRPYFSFMLIIQVTGNNIIYRMNTNVELNIYCVLFFSIINFIFGIVVGSFLYTFFEVPLKKLNKFILSKKEDNKNEEEIEEEDEPINLEPFGKEERISDTAL